MSQQSQRKQGRLLKKEKAQLGKRLALLRAVVNPESMGHQAALRATENRLKEVRSQLARI